MVFTPYVFPAVRHAGNVYVFCACVTIKKGGDSNIYWLDNKKLLIFVIVNIKIVLFSESLYFHLCNKNTELLEKSHLNLNIWFIPANMTIFNKFLLFLWSSCLYIQYSWVKKREKIGRKCMFLYFLCTFSENCFSFNTCKFFLQASILQSILTN